HPKLNANYELKCVKCNGCMLYDNHDLCVLDFINNVNARNKSKSVKKSLKKKLWKPTGKVFINIRYKWRPIGRTFTIVGNTCPLTRITTTTDVPLRKPTALESDTPKPVVTLVYSRKPRKSITNVPVSKYKDLKSVSANKKEPIQSWGSIVSDVQSSSLNECWTSKSFSGVDLLTGSRGNNLYTLSLGDMFASSPICLLSKASKTKTQDEAPDFIIKFLKMIHVRLNVPVRTIRTDNGTECFNQPLREYYEKVGISHETSVARSQQQNGVVERHNYTLIEASRIMLIYAKAPLFLWLLHDKLPDLSFFHVFGALCYSTNDSENLGKLQPKADIDFDELTAMASAQSSSGPTLHEMTPTTISSGFVPNPPPSTSFVPPSKINWDILFQPLFDELLNPPPIDQDAPSPSNSQTTPKNQPLVIPNDVEKDNHDIKVAHMGNDPYFGIPIPEVSSDQSSSSDIIHTIMPPDHQISEHNSKWTKDHPPKNIIGGPARPVSTTLQLHEQALLCYYDAFLSVVEPKTYKDALTQSY
ncbi:retrovirus-related pol polyprotein from transposon TNT 1-94, partial [Tanacetum coccineum]